MNVGELVRLLNQLPQDLPVYRYEDYEYQDHSVPISEVRVADSPTNRFTAVNTLRVELV